MTFASPATRHSRSVSSLCPVSQHVMRFDRCSDSHSSLNWDSIQTLSMRGRTLYLSARPSIVVMHALKGVKHSTFITALRFGRCCPGQTDGTAAAATVFHDPVLPCPRHYCMVPQCEWRSESALHSPHSSFFFC